MKNILTAIVGILVALSCTLASAAESIPIALAAPADIARQACPSPVWKDMIVVWKGIVDKRTDSDVGMQTQKGKEPIPVVADPPLAETLDAALKNILSVCGMKLVEKSEGAGDVTNLSAEVREFYAGVEKKLITGKSRAFSSISFLAQKGPQSQTVTVGFEMESKKIRSGDIKQLQKTLDQLLSETLKLIPATQEMRELK